QLAGEVRAGNVSRQVILASTVHDVIREWKRLVPESQTLLWMGGTESALKKRVVDLRASQFEGITQLQVHIYPNTNSLADDPFTLSRVFLRTLGADLRGQNILFQALPWGATKPLTYWQLLDMGFASFATDYPEVTLQAVREYYARAGQVSLRRRD
ncbi:MAG TPA: hypothetical protein VNT26_18265, partial [Candidatus Sulfotelmatobacter sp.]|nr:hypothetical protein [Candidatus Sulfotelmatobacter sp.]